MPAGPQEFHEHREVVSGVACVVELSLGLVEQVIEHINNVFSPHPHAAGPPRSLLILLVLLPPLIFAPQA